MGIESDHLVYEYLSRVGDLAQRRQLPSGDRMRLVAGLRDEIDRRRAKYDPETPAAVRRILERIGTPEEVLDTLGGGAGSVPAGESDRGPGVPTQRAPGRLRRQAPPPPPPPQTGAAPPHLAGLDELGASASASEPDWWRVGPPAPYGGGPQVDGFVGGIERPDLFGPVTEEEPEPQEEEAAAERRPGFVRALRNRRDRRDGRDQKTAAGPRPKPHVFLLLAALVLVAGVVTGEWLVLAAGWLFAYGSRVLGPAERKWVVFGLPGVVCGGALLWVWGRADGRWGEALGEGQAGEALTGMLPWVVRAAALASALYLLWRSRRP
ncbi:hypothetical protein DEJ50_14635 [Streptomyces venezuelae]|uniref:Uncharacterized protein n=1 Tax=Streptomyces venezuelae TaxID=54571 RepID=A0A5P2D6I1_STRVZ|nr:hypothetical protein [Streptomyces venezuelae]QES48871.1 hypothetical protein DEJ50_14635 [Streptomyces venezuelae]